MSRHLAVLLLLLLLRWRQQQQTAGRLWQLRPEDLTSRRGRELGQCNIHPRPSCNRQLSSDILLKPLLPGAACFTHHLSTLLLLVVLLPLLPATANPTLHLATLLLLLPAASDCIHRHFTLPLLLQRLQRLLLLLLALL
jgi:hypothetical protein